MTIHVLKVNKGSIHDAENFQIKKFPKNLKEHLYNVLRLCYCRAVSTSNDKKARIYLKKYMESISQDPTIDMILDDARSAYENRKSDDFIAYDNIDNEE